MFSASLAQVVISMGNASAQDEAADRDQDVPASTALGSTAQATAAGCFLPFAQPAFVAQRAFASGIAGYDSARKTGTFEATAEARLWGPIAVRGSAVYTNTDHLMRPSFGARAQALREERHGIDGAFGVFYRPEGLTEPEGEIESVLSVGRHAGQTYLLGNLLYGQDPEGSERDGELHLAALRPIRSRFVVGFDGRLRFDLGSNAAKLAEHHEATLDAMLGPSATAFAGPVALFVNGGAAAVRLQQQTSYGAFVMLGIGTAL
jgi:hypothetical protein